MKRVPSIRQKVGRKTLRLVNGIILYPAIVMDYYGLTIKFGMPYKNGNVITYDCDLDVDDFCDHYDERTYDPDDPKQPLDNFSEILVNAYPVLTRIPKPVWDEGNGVDVTINVKFTY